MHCYYYTIAVKIFLLSVAVILSPFSVLDHFFIYFITTILPLIYFIYSLLFSSTSTQTGLSLLCFILIPTIWGSLGWLYAAGQWASMVEWEFKVGYPRSKSDTLTTTQYLALKPNKKCLWSSYKKWLPFAKWIWQNSWCSGISDF